MTIKPIVTLLLALSAIAPGTQAAEHVNSPAGEGRTLIATMLSTIVLRPPLRRAGLARRTAQRGSPSE